MQTSDRADHEFAEALRDWLGWRSDAVVNHSHTFGRKADQALHLACALLSDSNVRREPPRHPTSQPFQTLRRCWDRQVDDRDSSDARYEGRGEQRKLAVPGTRKVCLEDPRP